MFINIQRWEMWISSHRCRQNAVLVCLTLISIFWLILKERKKLIVGSEELLKITLLSRKAAFNKLFSSQSLGALFWLILQASSIAENGDELWCIFQDHNSVVIIIFKWFLHPILDSNSHPEIKSPLLYRLSQPDTSLIP